MCRHQDVQFVGGTFATYGQTELEIYRGLLHSDSAPYIKIPAFRCALDSSEVRLASFKSLIVAGGDMFQPMILATKGSQFVDRKGAGIIVTDDVFVIDGLWRITALIDMLREPTNYQKAHHLTAEIIFEADDDLIQNLYLGVQRKPTSSISVGD